MHPNMRRAHDIAWERFYNEETQVFYGVEFSDPSRYSPPEEVATELPGCAGRGIGLGDVCLDTGWRLEGLLSAYRVTGDAEWADKARNVFHGLVWLASVPKIKGFVPRGVYPGRTDYYPHSSRDQYTSFIYSMWNYSTSGIATDEEKQKAAELVVNICRRVEGFGHNLPTSEGKECIHGDLSMFRPGGSDRLLQFYRTAYVLSGDSHWQDLYLQKLEEDLRVRLQTCGWGPRRISWRKNVHGIYQSQAALRMLLATETDPDARFQFRRALNDHAEAVMTHIDLWHIFTRSLSEVVERSLEEVWEDYRELFSKYYGSCDEFSYHPGVHTWYHFMRENKRYSPTSRDELDRPLYCPLQLPKLRHLIEATAAVMMSKDQSRKEDAAEKAWPFLSSLDYSVVRKNGITCFLESAYWRGVEAGVFPQD